MRRSAYIKALEQTILLPESIPELERYFRQYYNPRAEAINLIKTLARQDVKLLGDVDCAEILQWKGSYAKDNNDSSTKQTKNGEEDRECSGSDIEH